MLMAGVLIGIIWTVVIVGGIGAEGAASRQDASVFEADVILRMI